MVAVVDELQALVEERLPWLKDDIFSSEVSNPRTPSPDIELGVLSESEEAAPENHTPECWMKCSSLKILNQYS